MFKCSYEHVFKFFIHYSCFCFFQVIKNVLVFFLCRKHTQQRNTVSTELTSELTISSGTLCTMETIAVEMGVCCFPFRLCSLQNPETHTISHSVISSSKKSNARVLFTDACFIKKEKEREEAHCVKSWPHSAHRPFITMGWLHSSILAITSLLQTNKHV